MRADNSEPDSSDSDVLAIAAERMTFFTDAVLAIALTLLALGLPVPPGTTNTALLDSMGNDLDDYAAFIISFVVIAAHWRGHHYLFRHVDSTTRRLNFLNLGWLLAQVFTPFATEVISGEGAFETRFILYALVQTWAGAFFVLMAREIRRHHLYRATTPAGVITAEIQRSWVLTAAFAISIPVALVTHWAYLCWIVIPFGSIGYHRLISGRKAS